MCQKGLGIETLLWQAYFFLRGRATSSICVFYVAIDFILIVFLYNFAFFVCEKLTTKNEKRTFGYI